MTLEDLKRAVDYHNSQGGAQLSLIPSNGHPGAVDIYRNNNIFLLSLDYTAANHVVAGLIKAMHMDRQEAKKSLDAQPQLDVVVLTCVHEFHNGDSLYVSIHPDEQSANAHIETVMKEADYDIDDDREFFNSATHHVTMDLRNFIDQAKSLEAIQVLPQQGRGEGAHIEHPVTNAPDELVVRLAHLAGEMEANKHIDLYDWDELVSAIQKIVDAYYHDTNESFNPTCIEEAAEYYFIDQFGTEEYKETLSMNALTGKSPEELIALAKSKENHMHAIFEQNTSKNKLTLDRIIAGAEHRAESAGTEPRSQEKDMEH